jgi:hypothetical protein
MLHYVHTSGAELLLLWGEQGTSIRLNFLQSFASDSRVGLCGQKSLRLSFPKTASAQPSAYGENL